MGKVLVEYIPINFGYRVLVLGIWVWVLVRVAAHHHHHHHHCSTVFTQPATSFFHLSLSSAYLLISWFDRWIFLSPFNRILPIYSVQLVLGRPCLLLANFYSLKKHSPLFFFVSFIFILYKKAFIFVLFFVSLKSLKTNFCSWKTNYLCKKH